MLGKRKVPGFRVEAPRLELKCMICLEIMETAADFFPLTRCPHIFHPECLRPFFESEISELKFPIKCPLAECKGLIDH